MRNPTPYLKMRVLGAIDMAEGNSIRARIKAVSHMTFTDEDGHARRFTWRTIQTWYSRYQKHGLTLMENKSRSDKGRTRKVVLEDLHDAVRKVLPKIHGKPPHQRSALPPLHRGRPAHTRPNRSQHLLPPPQAIPTAQARHRGFP